LTTPKPEPEPESDKNHEIRNFGLRKPDPWTPLL